MDMLDYNKIRPLMSVEDVIDFYSLPNIFETDVSNLFTPISGFIEANDTPEFRNVIQPSLYSQDSIGRNRSSLTLPEIEAIDMNFNDVCKIKVINTNVIIVFIKPGFVNVLNDLQSKLLFLRSLLKTLYTLQPLHEVSKSNVYSLYLKTLLK